MDGETAEDIVSGARDSIKTLLKKRRGQGGTVFAFTPHLRQGRLSEADFTTVLIDEDVKFL